MVTGASRGIGRACALALAGAGYDVAVTARTIDGRHLGGGPARISLATTTAEIEALGARALAVPLDLLDRDSLVPAVEAVLTDFGHIDVLVNNAIYVGQGNDERFLDVSIDDLDKRIYANITAQLAITQRALRAMVSRGGGTVVNVTSMAGMISPPGPLGDGGWALGYAVSKGGFHRAAGVHRRRARRCRHPRVQPAAGFHRHRTRHIPAASGLDRRARQSSGAGRPNPFVDVVR